MKTNRSASAAAGKPATSNLTRRFNEGEWEVVETLTEGGPSRSYFPNGRRALIIDQLPKSSLQVTGLRLIEKDIRTVESWITLLRAELGKIGGDPADSFLPKGDHVYCARALFVAIITTYGKMFTEAKGRRVKLDRADWVSEVHAKTHDILIELRNEFAAHGGVGQEKCRTLVAVDSAKGSRVPPKIFVELDQPALPSRVLVRLIRKMLRELHERVLSKIAEASERLTKDMMASLDQTTIRQRKRNAEKRHRQLRR